MSLNVGSHPLLGPLVGLTSWTLVMEVWMYAQRIPAIGKYKVNVSDPRRVKEEFAKIPPEIEFPAANYNHLQEQPTQFYATLLALTFLGVEDTTTVRMAWGYVGLRVLHSLIQATSNPIMIRFRVFVTSSAVLAALTAKLALKLYRST